jgi:RNA polymerase sigma factor (sigma-70 family)
MPPRVAAELSADIIARARLGHLKAQAQVLSRYAGPVHHLFRRTWPQADAEEMTQTVLHKVLVGLPAFEPSGPATLSTWVFSIAHHLLIDAQRKHRLQLVPISQATHVPDTNLDARELVWNSQVRDAIEKAIARLPPEQARVVALVHWYEQPLLLIAEIEGVPVGTIKSRLFRGRATLAQLLGPLLSEELP